MTNISYQTFFNDIALFNFIIFNFDELKNDDLSINDDKIEKDILIDYCDSKKIYTSRKIQILMSRSIFFIESSLTIMICDIILFIKI